jgi:hypothetical protein
VTAAAPDNTLVSAPPRNQESTMAAFATQPSYPLPPGARAIMNARSALQGSGARPLYNDPQDIDPSRFASILGRLRGSLGADANGGGLAALGVDYGAPAPAGSPQSMPADGSSATDAGNAAARNLQAQPGAMDPSTFGQSEQDYGPTNQTAPGGVMDQIDMSTPDAWRSFFTMQNTQGARAPRGPRIMAGSRLPGYQR